MYQLWATKSVVSNHRFLEAQRSAAEAKPVNSPHPFRGAGRDEILTNFLRILELGGGSPPPPTPLKKHAKIEEKNNLEKKKFFHESWLKSEPQSGPQNR